MTTGIGSIALALTLALTLTLLAMAPPSGAQVRQVPGVGLGNAPPTAALSPTASASATATSTPAPTPTSTPSGPVVDAGAAAVLAQMSASVNLDTACQSNPNGASLPAGRVYISLCFRSNRIPAGGTVSVQISPPGAAPLFQQSAGVSAGSQYLWFLFGLGNPGPYSVAVYWNGALAKVYPLTIG
jgi:hypothetical protein